MAARHSVDFRDNRRYQQHYEQFLNGAYPDMHEIPTTGIFLGSENANKAAAGAVLSRHNVKYIINCLDSGQTLATMATYLNIAVPKTCTEENAAQFAIQLNDASDIIEKAVGGGGCVLVFDRDGSTRASSIVIGYLMRKRRLTYEQAYKLVEQQRAFLEPSMENFLGGEFEAAVLAASAAVPVGPADAGGAPASTVSSVEPVPFGNVVSEDILPDPPSIDAFISRHHSQLSYEEASQPLEAAIPSATLQGAQVVVGTPDTIRVAVNPGDWLFPVDLWGNEAAQVLGVAFDATSRRVPCAVMLPHGAQYGNDPFPPPECWTDDNFFAYMRSAPAATEGYDGAFVRAFGCTRKQRWGDNAVRLQHVTDSVNSPEGNWRDVRLALRNECSRAYYGAHPAPPRRCIYICLGQSFHIVLLRLAEVAAAASLRLEEDAPPPLQGTLVVGLVVEASSQRTGSPSAEDLVRQYRQFASIFMEPASERMSVVPPVSFPSVPHTGPHPRAAAPAAGGTVVHRPVDAPAVSGPYASDPSVVYPVLDISAAAPLTAVRVTHAAGPAGSARMTGGTGTDSTASSEMASTGRTAQGLVQETARAADRVTMRFDFTELARSTNNFADEYKLGEGGFGPVHRARMRGQDYAVKSLSASSMQGETEFVNEVATLAMLRHENIVTLAGIAIAPPPNSAKYLVYELAPNGTLDDKLFPRRGETHLSWAERLRIALGAAKGLLYMHTASPPIIHRDFKGANVLLSRDMTAKVGDFGLVRFATELVEGRAPITMQVYGTYGYICPTAASTGQMSLEMDVFALGVVLAQVLTARQAIQSGEPLWLWIAAQKHAIDLGTKAVNAIVDSRPGVAPCPEPLARELMNLAVRCVQQLPSMRPSMQSVADDIQRLLDQAVAAEPARSALPPADRCCVCQTRRAVVVFLPCNHMSACDTCGGPACTACPRCSTVATGKVTVST